jgi:hypothetical protein
MPGAAGAATVMINDGAYHEINDATYNEDYVYVRNADCPPNWPTSGNPWDFCSNPGDPTDVER